MVIWTNSSGSTSQPAATQSSPPSAPAAISDGVMERTILIASVGGAVLFVLAVVAVIVCVIARRKRKRRSEVSRAVKNSRAPGGAPVVPTPTLASTAAGQQGNNYETCRQNPRQTATNVGTAKAAALAVAGCDRRFIELPTTMQPCPIAVVDDAVPPAQRLGASHSGGQVTRQGSYPKVALRPPTAAMAGSTSSSACRASTRGSKNSQERLLPPAVGSQPLMPTASATTATAATVMQPLLIECHGGDEHASDDDNERDEDNEDYYDDDSAAQLGSPAGAYVRGYVDMSLSPLLMSPFRGPGLLASDRPPQSAAAAGSMPQRSKSAVGPSSPLPATAGTAAQAANSLERGDDFTVEEQSSGCGGDTTAAALDDYDVEGHDCMAPRGRRGSSGSHGSGRSSGSSAYENEEGERYCNVGAVSDRRHAERRSRVARGEAASEDEDDQDYYNSVVPAALYVNVRR